MIEITFTAVLYGALSCFMFLYTSASHARHVPRAEKQFLLCLAVPVPDEDAATLFQCPRCGSYNTIADGQDRRWAGLQSPGCRRLNWLPRERG